MYRALLCLRGLFSLSLHEPSTANIEAHPAENKGPIMATTKIAVSLPDSTIDKLKQLAGDSDLTVSAVLQWAVATLRFLKQEEAASKRLVLQRPDGKLQEVTFR